MKNQPTKYMTSFCPDGWSRNISEPIHFTEEEACKHITKVSDSEWILETEVCSFEGVGRFIMGLLQDVEIVGPQELRLFIRNKLLFTEKI